MLQKKFIMGGLLALMCLLPLTANAEEEELAPGFDACMDKAATTAETRNCLREAQDYWDKILNENFKKAKDHCAQATSPKECSENLVAAQRQWIKYKEMTPAVIRDLHGGSMGTQIADDFLATETKKQARLLQVPE